MVRKIQVFLVVAAMCVFWFGGCKKKVSSETSGEQKTPKTMIELEDEAEEQITKDNMLEELEKIEKQVESEISEEAE